MTVNLLRLEDVKGLRRAEVLERYRSEADASEKLWKKYDETDGDLSSDEAEEIRGREGNMAALKARIDELTALEVSRENQKGLRDFLNEPAGGITHPGSNGNGKAVAPDAGLSLGERFLKSAAYTEFSVHSRKGPVVELEMPKGYLSGMDTKALLNLAAYPIQPTDTGMVVMEAMRRPVIADLIPQAATTAPAIRYVEETTNTNAAAGTLEGALKPESALGFVERTATTMKIATYIPVTDELVADRPAIAGLIDGRLRLFIQLEEERQLLSGTGTAPETLGILNKPGIQTEAIGTDTVPDAVFKAMTLIQTVAFLDASGVVINPLDWQGVRLLKNTLGDYIWGPPSVPGPATLWGLPVVSTTAISQGTALVAAFNAASQILRRQGVTVDVSSEHADFFIRNQMAIRAEERLLLLIFRPSAFCQITGIPA